MCPSLRDDTRTAAIRTRLPPTYPSIGGQLVGDRDSVAGLPILLLLMVMAGCQPEMTDQPRVDTYEHSAFFADGAGSRMQVPGTVARGQRWVSSPATTGIRHPASDDGSARPFRSYITNPLPLTESVLREGQKLFHTNCQHCHGRTGYGDGMVVQRGFPHPPSYHTDRVRDLPDGRIFEVITEGFGRMPSLGRLIPVEDRWKIVAFVRVLQLSQNVPEASLSAAEREALADADEASSADEGSH